MSTLRFRALALVFAFAILPSLASAQTASDIQKQIDDNNAQISQLDTEIAQYQTQLDATTQQKNTLQNTVNQLALQSKQLTAKITVTKSQINTTQLQIQQLAAGIATKQSTIDDEESGLAQSLRTLDATEQVPLSITLLSAGNISDAWQDIDAIASIQSAVQTDIVQLAADKQSLTTTKTAAEAKRAQLLTQQQTLTTQQGSLNATKKAQSDLLAQTKSQESAYQALIAQKKSQESSLEQALSDLKSQYNVAVNPDQITAPGAGILNWPFAGSFMSRCATRTSTFGNSFCITQYFGDTPFAQAHASLYSGHGHDGVDISAPIGTPVLAALSGTVLATGNTDAVKGCYSFGKWVMLKHNNGINTMYAHLSQINVTQGQSVATGDVLGYSGETGYATGPHLHFGVYVSSVTQILALGKATNTKTPCSTAVMPVPPLSGYLNPLNYLPTT
jgi:murein DD-endopeptidase MepM/ murein hydrolase activator NlpD